MVNITVIYMDGSKENFVGATRVKSYDPCLCIFYGEKKRYCIPYVNVKRLTIEEVSNE